MAETIIPNIEAEDEQFLPIGEVQEMTGGMSDTTIWRMRRAKQFPEPVSISPNRKAWRKSDITTWMKARMWL